MDVTNGLFCGVVKLSASTVGLVEGGACTDALKKDLDFVISDSEVIVG